MNKLVVKLTGIDGIQECIVVQEIQRMKEMPKVSKAQAKDEPACTHVYLAGCAEPVRVTESVLFIMQLATQHSNSLGWVKQ